MYALLASSFKFTIRPTHRCFSMTAVKNLTSQQLKDILTGETRSKYQIVDVREPDELKGNIDS